MPRQRLRSHTSPLSYVGRLLLVLVCLAAIWYGLVVLGLALGFLGADVADSVSYLYSGFAFLAGLQASDFASPVTRVAMIGGGLVAFLLFGYLALKEIPRPYLARHSVELGEDDRGVVAVDPRAIERCAEGAALGHPTVSSATGRYSDEDLEVDVSANAPRDVPDTLRDVQQRVRDALGRHDLPPHPVSVILTGYEPSERPREIT
jgi:hypothetical protein